MIQDLSSRLNSAVLRNNNSDVRKLLRENKHLIEFLSHDFLNSIVARIYQSQPILIVKLSNHLISKEKFDFICSEFSFFALACMLRLEYYQAAYDLIVVNSLFSSKIPLNMIISLLMGLLNDKANHSDEIKFLIFYIKLKYTKEEIELVKTLSVKAIPKPTQQTQQGDTKEIIYTRKIEDPEKDCTIQ